MRHLDRLWERVMVPRIQAQCPFFAHSDTYLLASSLSPTPQSHNEINLWEREGGKSERESETDESKNKKERTCLLFIENKPFSIFGNGRKTQQHIETVNDPYFTHEQRSLLSFKSWVEIFYYVKRRSSFHAKFLAFFKPKKIYFISGFYFTISFPPPSLCE